MTLGVRGLLTVLAANIEVSHIADSDIVMLRLLLWRIT